MSSTGTEETTTHLAHSAGSLATHDHACAVHRSYAELAAAATAFARGSFADRMRLLHVAAERPRDAVLEDLDRSGLDPAGRLASRQLEVVDAHEAYLAGGAFDVGDMVARLGDEVAAAHADGWAGFRVAGEMGWALDARVEPHALVDYEQRVDEVFRRSQATALCLYDASRFGTDVLRRLADVHPLRLCEPDGDRPPTWAAARVERTPDGALALCGEFDLGTQGALEASLRRAAGDTGDLRLDLRELAFVDVRGLALLSELAAERGRAGHRVFLIGAPRIVRTVLELLADDPDRLRWERA